MKSVLISIQPKWCELIASGIKTIEVRKTRPKLETPFKVYIYMTMGKCPKFVYNEKLEKQSIYDRDPSTANGRVIGEFVCDKIYQYSTTQNCKGIDITDEEMTKASCLTKKEIEDYEFSAEAKDYCIYKIGVFGWHISNLVIYDKPRELSEFYQIGKKNDYNYYDYCSGCPYHETPVSEYPCAKCDGNRKYLYRPPQSWCYVESEDTE